MSDNRDYCLKQCKKELEKQEAPIVASMKNLLDAFRAYGPVEGNGPDKIQAAAKVVFTASELAKLLDGNWETYVAAKDKFEKEFRDLHPANGAHQFVSWGGG